MQIVRGEAFRSNFEVKGIVIAYINQPVPVLIASKGTPHLFVDIPMKEVHHELLIVIGSMMLHIWRLFPKGTLVRCLL